MSTESVEVEQLKGFLRIVTAECQPPTVHCYFCTVEKQGEPKGLGVPYFHMVSRRTTGGCQINYTYSCVHGELPFTGDYASDRGELSLEVSIIEDVRITDIFSQLRDLAPQLQFIEVQNEWRK